MRPRPTPGQELLISEARTVLGRQKVIEGQAENVVEIEQGAPPVDVGLSVGRGRDEAVAPIAAANCCGILPLDQWAPEDRETLIDLYQRANPECSSNAPSGWTSKFDLRARF
jgi:hypothetical protein